jgi:hypothetical protein
MENMDDVRMRQGADTADLWLRQVVRSLDDVFGEGYARATPEVVAAMLAAAASDFRTTNLSGSIDRLADAVHSGLSNMGR